MMLIDVMKEVSFEGVKRQLLLTHRPFEGVMDEFKAYFTAIQSTPSTLQPLESQIVMNREFFETAYFIPNTKQDVRESLTTFVPLETMLASQVKQQDLDELDKDIIVAGALCMLTSNGICFNEEERKQEIERTKEQLKELSKIAI
ncbi:hypothetical protein PP175_26465 (plasmid) [Aneurinibacillus sp. Ricciae_BoGa-3]|uniref:hypothetical protein n=1 Tax=Aneurinibacillus sp. Ricciae_BoGa-3 TaxID=3022697 RepID=UPI00233FEC6A|nr:hypothetical protein [Aneurinibacillus sp. Ricciae_BoGa-3]WCK57609.1 hypothetical protein PP175_26465 [Aneurinibacillus sp. Ricciae_BoGa-3]